MKEIVATPFAAKHREDVIDTLQLRLKERRVLYVLMIVLLTTFAYENSSSLYSIIAGDSHQLPELGARSKPKLSSKEVLRLDTALAKAADDFPQYWARFSKNRENLSVAISSLAEEGGMETAMAKVAATAASLQEFIAHPLIKPTKNLEKLQAEIESVQRLFKFNGCSTKRTLKPLDFTREARKGSRQIKRNLFEYGLR